MIGIEPFLQKLRIKKISKYIQPNPQGILIDFGCDHEQTLISKYSPFFLKVVGIDIESNPHMHGNMEIINSDLNTALPLKTNSAAYITILAVLEHLKNPVITLSEAYRILKPGGKLLLTVPSPMAKIPLEIMAKFYLVRQDMIDQHENYFTKKQLFDLAGKTGFKSISIQNWELGMNTLLVATK